jgi:hypothetical protein
MDNATTVPSLITTQPTLTAIVTDLLPKQRRFIAVYTLCQDEAQARGLANVGLRTWYRWKKDTKFMQALYAARELQASGEAIAMLASEHTFTVIKDIIEMATRPWDDCNAATLRTKRWAMEIFLGLIAAQPQSVKNSVSVKNLILNLGEAAKSPWMQNVVDTEVVNGNK